MPGVSSSSVVGSSVGSRQSWERLKKLSATVVVGLYGWIIIGWFYYRLVGWIFFGWLDNRLVRWII